MIELGGYHYNVEGSADEDVLDSPALPSPYEPCSLVRVPNANVDECCGCVALPAPPHWLTCAA